MISDKEGTSREGAATLRRFHAPCISSILKASKEKNTNRETAQSKIVNFDDVDI